ncbi:MAG TPA: ribosome assembly RNA-binding protein YhbY [Longimicrobiales bacterium]
MAELTPRQRAVLRSLAQSIKPILQIGKDGVTDALAQSVGSALSARELLKVKVLETAPGSAQELAEALVAHVPDAQLVQVIGRTIVVFRRNPEKPEITLPSV